MRKTEILICELVSNIMSLFGREFHSFCCMNDQTDKFGFKIKKLKSNDTIVSSVSSVSFKLLCVFCHGKISSARLISLRQFLMHLAESIIANSN